MRLTCPFCGERDHAEFTYCGDAGAVRPAIDNPSVEAHAIYVFDRENPVGAHREIWNHTSGCRTHVLVMRDVSTHEILSSEPVGPFAKILKRSRAK